MSVSYTKEGDYHIIIIKGKSRFVPIIRETEELFSETVTRSQKLANFTLCINGSWYGVPKTYWAEAGIGNPVHPKNITNEGIALRANGTPLGRTSPDLFYFAQKSDGSYEIGLGDPSSKKGHNTGLGGLCPLVYKGLKYGVTNLYQSKTPLTNTVLTGEPKPEHRPYLVRRSSAKYKGLFEDDYQKAGRVGIGFTPNNDLVVIL